MYNIGGDCMVNIDNLFKMISEKGITQSKLAENTSISTGNISDWKKGKSMPSAVKLDELATYFDCSVDYLLGRTENPNLSSINDSNNGIINNNSSVNNSNQTIGSNSLITDETAVQLLEAFQKLDIFGKAEVINLIVKLSQKAG